MNITDKAQKYLDCFETSKREDGTEFVHLKDTFKPEALYESIKNAHGDRFPNDWIYGTYADLLQRVTEHEPETIDDLENSRAEIVDSYVDIYTADLTKWLADDINNVNYLTDAMEELQPANGFNLLAHAQYLAIDEVMQEVINLLGTDTIDPYLPGIIEQEAERPF